MTSTLYGTSLSQAAVSFSHARFFKLFLFPCLTYSHSVLAFIAFIAWLTSVSALRRYSYVDSLHYISIETEPILHLNDIVWTSRLDWVGLVWLLL